MQDQPAESDKAVTLFLSYARADSAVAQRLASALERAGFTLWWDAMIAGGEAYSRSISDALEKADLVIVLWSKRSVESDWVKDEAGHGRDRHRLIPLSVDGTQPPLGFRQYQVIDLSHWHGRKDAPEIAAIQRAIQSVLHGEHPMQGPAPTGVSRRTALIGGSTVAAGGAW